MSTHELRRRVERAEKERGGGDGLRVVDIRHATPTDAEKAIKAAGAAMTGKGVFIVIDR